MYSPKIREDLIPKIYRLGKMYKKPMTEVVDEILRSYLNGIGDFRRKRLSGDLDGDGVYRQRRKTDL